MNSLLYGRHVVSLLLARHPQRAHRLFVLAGEDAANFGDAPARRTSRPRQQALADLVALAGRANVPVHTESREGLDRRCEGAVHQGAVCEAEPFAYAPLDALCAPPPAMPGQLASPPLVVVLDQIQDPRNLGALVRSALAFGATGVLVPKDRSAAMTPAAMKASAGAGLVLPLAQAVNLRRALATLDGHGLWLTGLAADGDKLVRAVDWCLPSALVIGAEGSGLRALTKKSCHQMAAIEAVGMESLNAATAGAIALYEAATQRHRLTLAGRNL